MCNPLIAEDREMPRRRQEPLPSDYAMARRQCAELDSAAHRERAEGWPLDIATADLLEAASARLAEHPTAQGRMTQACLRLARLVNDRAGEPDRAAGCNLCRRVGHPVDEPCLP